MSESIDSLLIEIKSRTIKGASNFYKPLEDPEQRKILHQYYYDELMKKNPTFLGTNINKPLINESGTVIADGFTRTVIGDYGAYVEISADQIKIGNLRPKFGTNKPNRPVKYIWLVTNDSSITKIYEQKKTVNYADYKPGFYYVDPYEVIIGV